MTRAALNEYEHRKFCTLLKSFHQAYQIKGTYQMKFGARTRQDSDNEGVIDVYLTPLDEQASESSPNISERHLQFLESMVPATISGMQYIVKIEDAGPRPDVEILEILSPVSQ